ncbi:hypothetical protein L3Q82_020062, partial [Scortum barcoo]
VMKRVRTEQIQYAVAQYLKRRQYVDTDGSLKGARLFQSAEEMAASLTAVQTESGCANIVSAAPCQSDPQQYETQFSRLRSFLSETEISWAKEVSSILYPLFVYLHLDMVNCGLKGAVDGFYGRFHGAFLQDSEQRAVIEQLRHVLTAQDVAANPKLSAFLEHKYVVHLTEPAYSYLLRYLQSEDNSALCRALSTHLQVEVTASRRTDYQLYGAAGGVTATPNSTSSWAGVDGVDGGEGVEVPAGIPQSEAALEALQDCIKKVREGPPTLTTVCFYAFHHTEQMLNTAEVSADSRLLLAAGFDSSTVKLWSLRARKLKAKPHQADVSLIHLACDVLEEEVEEEDGSGSEIKTLRGHSGPVFRTAFLTDSSGLLSCSEDTTIRYWDLGSFTNTALYQGHAYPVWDVDVSPCSLYFASGSNDRTARLSGRSPAPTRCGSTPGISRRRRLRQIPPQLQLPGHRLHRQDCPAVEHPARGHLRGHTDSVTSLSFSPDSSLVASSSMDNSVRVWDIRNSHGGTPADGSSSELVGLYTGNTSNVLNVQFMACNLLLVTGTAQEKAEQ